VLVTGGAGFVGSALAATLARAGHAVCVLDDLSSGTRRPKLDGVEFVQGSVLDGDAVAAASAGCDLVCHLAALVGVRRVVDEPLRTLRVNALGTQTVAFEALRRGAALLYASSSEVYGQGLGRAMREDDPLLVGAGDSRRWVYAHTKLAGEWCVQDLVRRAGLRALTVRFFNTTGADQSPASGMVLPSMAASAVEHGRVVVHGDGRQVRSFCDVRDTVRALVLLCERAPFDGATYNIGSNEAVAIDELARLVADATGARCEHVPYDAAFGAGFEDVARRVPDVTRLAHAVGFAPRIALAELVASAVDAARERQRASAARAAP
jgi:UDP-glucose 4-epimerase